jgi:hypothetical protein
MVLFHFLLSSRVAQGKRAVGYHPTEVRRSKLRSAKLYFQVKDKQIFVIINLFFREVVAVPWLQIHRRNVGQTRGKAEPTLCWLLRLRAIQHSDC